MKNETDIMLASTIKSVRENLGITQEKLAEKVGVCTRHISDIENGKKSPSFGVLYQIVRVLGMRSEDLFYPDNSEPDTLAQHISRLLLLCGERDLIIVLGVVKTLLEYNK